VIDVFGVVTGDEMIRGRQYYINTFYKIYKIMLLGLGIHNLA